jgi:mannose-1-phosphate guanylyltransferase
MRALLLAAGTGSRLKPLTNIVPKCLVEICNKPLLEYWLILLSSNLIDEIFINLNHLSEKVQLFLENRINSINIVQLYEDELLGTAGTIKKNYEKFCGEPLMVIHADNLSKFDLSAFKNTFDNRASNIEITMMTFYADEPKNCGIVELDERGVVVKFHEKVTNPPGNLANGAVYIVSSGVIDFIYNKKGCLLDFSKDVIPYFIGKINTYHNNIYHRDIGTPESLDLAMIEFGRLTDYFPND